MKDRYTCGQGQQLRGRAGKKGSFRKPPPVGTYKLQSLVSGYGEILEDIGRCIGTGLQDTLQAQRFHPRS